MGSEETQPPDERRSTKLFALRAAIVSGKYAINAKNIARRVIDEL
ncbi:MAG: flagellar biosynthesis anti-sigma factor FlgM [Dehalococcoidia bacterium]